MKSAPTALGLHFYRSSLLLPVKEHDMPGANTMAKLVYYRNPDSLFQCSRDLLPRLEYLLHDLRICLIHLG